MAAVGVQRRHTVAKAHTGNRNRKYNAIKLINADVVELVDSVDLGSSVIDVQVRVLSSAPKILNAKAFGIFTYYLFTLHSSL